jgi:hypothetical protein
MSTDDRRGRCYELALAAFLVGEGPELPAGAVLVHGYPHLQGGEFEGEKYGHAWIEWHEKVEHPMFTDDGDKPVVFQPAPLYYKVGQIDPDECVTYSRAEAREMIVEHETYGPWEKIPDDAIFGPPT